MTAFRQQQSLQAVDSLVANGGTNIAEGLRKAARVVVDR
jgi:Mg-chelatase subunit ChlD